MKNQELRQMGIPHGEPLRLAAKTVGDARLKGMEIGDIRARLAKIVADPAAHEEDAVFGALAKAIAAKLDAEDAFVSRMEPAPHRQWGEGLEPNAVKQLQNACELPVSVRGALMPDAHVGYGLPIGGVLATRDAVIPYAVGVDIACRVKLSILDLPVTALERREHKLIKAIKDETRFGVGASFRQRREHDVMDRDWSITATTTRVKDKAWSQLGSSGSGNHFVEFGVFEIDNDQLGVEPGKYLALLSHSGSRGAGAEVAGHYSKLAMSKHPELPRELQHLAWLSLDSDAGQQYWEAMQLMGEYASANHACIHRHVAQHLGAEVLADVENHHNFAWKETHFGEDVIVHRKGATPAGEGVLGVIPGSMASPTYVVRGKGEADSLNSAAHGAGRVMSRSAAKRKIAWPEVTQRLRQYGVKLLSAGLDEAPMVYKNINEVMAAQSDLVDIVARFKPRIVKMAEAGERPED